MFLKRKKQTPGPPQEAEPEPRFQNKHIPEAFDLGWYYSENKDEFQMAKIAGNVRDSHFYVIGTTRAGKTKFLEFLIRQDIERGNGFAVIDPHGDLIEDIKGYLAFMAREYAEEDLLVERTVLIEPTNPSYTVTFNPLEKSQDASVPEQVNELVGVFKKIWSDSWGSRMEDLMRNSMIALGETGYTLCEMPAFLTKRTFRKSVLDKVSHPNAREYFNRFEVLTDRGQTSWVEPVMNKINAFLSDDRIREMFSSPESSFNLREIMDNKKFLLVNLNKGKLKGASDLLGSLLMAKLQMAAFSRSDIPQSRRVPFYLYIDEFQNFASESFEVVLSEARKYGLSLIMAHQNLSQIPDKLRSMILGNTGIQVYFQINRHDASILAKEAFKYSGFEVKSAGLSGQKYWSLGEEWEKHTAELQSLSPRICYIKHRLEGGVIPVHTVEMEPGYELLEMDELEYYDLLHSVPFGMNYMRGKEKLARDALERQKLIGPEEKRPEKALKELTEPVVKQVEPKPSKKDEPKEELLPEEKSFIEFVSRNPGMFVTKIYQELGLSGYKGDKLKKSLIDKDLIKQEETREGKRGRLAKVLFVTDKGASAVEKTGHKGKGGDVHRQLQAMLREQAGILGWKGKVEKRIPKTLESVDIELKKADIKAAVEISDTSTPEHELSNIRKCLDAGYDYVFSVCPDEKQLARIKTDSKKTFPFKERERLKFCLPSGFRDVLSGISPPIVSEKGIDSGQIKEQKELMGTETAAEFLGISRNTLYEWIVQRKVPYIKVGRLVKFKRPVLEEWLKKREKKEDDLW